MPESPRDIRRRIQSTKNIAQITRAFQQLATARLRRAQSRASESRPYADSIREVLTGLAGGGGSDVTHPLLEQREVGTVGVIEVTPDRGLVGGLIANLNRTVSRFVVEQSHPVRGYALGRRGRDFLRRSGVELAGEEINLGDYPEIERILGVARIVIDEYTDGTVDQVHLAYTRYISTVRQESTIIQLIPVQPEQASQEGKEGADGGAAIQYEYEPDAAAVLNSLLPRYIETQIYRAVLEAKASEQAARLVAMRNATDNANELVGDYTLSLNKARQASITTEIAEISAAAEALR